MGGRVHTSSSAMADIPHELGNFKGLGHFEAKFNVLHQYL